MTERRIVPDLDAPAIDLEDVEVRVPGRTLLSGATWRVEHGDHWVVLGRNGAGKTTLLSVAAAQRHPSGGTASILGHRMGRIDVRELRRYIGLVTTGQRLLDAEQASAHTVVLTGHTGTVQPLWDRYDDAVHARAHKLLSDFGCGHLADRPINVCSQGERARVRIARALMADPALLLLDEPFAGLDLNAREDLIDALRHLAVTRPRLPTVLVTHHLEEIPESATHALLIRDGRFLAGGELRQTLTDELMSACYDRPLRIHDLDGRWTAQTRRNLVG
jgi:iron complex transport system ATP-binding protein